MADPLHQFQIAPLIPINVAGADLSFTNSALWMAIAVGCAYLLIMAGTRQHAMVPGRLQSAVEMLYEFVAGILRDAAGKEGMRFFPIIFTIFVRRARKDSASNNSNATSNNDHQTRCRPSTSRRWS